jgi:hypothetical protein
LVAFRVFPPRVLLDIAAPFPSNVAPTRRRLQFRACIQAKVLVISAFILALRRRHRTPTPSRGGDRIRRISALGAAPIFKRPRHAR